MKQNSVLALVTLALAVVACSEEAVAPNSGGEARPTPTQGPWNTGTVGPGSGNQYSGTPVSVNSSIMPAYRVTLNAQTSGYLAVVHSQSDMYLCNFSQGSSISIKGFGINSSLPSMLQNINQNVNVPVGGAPVNGGSSGGNNNSLLNMIIGVVGGLIGGAIGGGGSAPASGYGYGLSSVTNQLMPSPLHVMVDSNVVSTIPVSTSIHIVNNQPTQQNGGSCVFTATSQVFINVGEWKVTSVTGENGQAPLLKFSLGSQASVTDLNNQPVCSLSAGSQLGLFVKGYVDPSSQASLVQATQLSGTTGLAISSMAPLTIQNFNVTGCNQMAEGVINGGNLNFMP